MVGPNYCSRKNFPFQSIAAVGAKEALWRLYRAGYQVAIFVHDECVVSVPEISDLDEDRRKIAQIMEQAMATFLDGLPVTVETEEPQKAWGVFPNQSWQSCEAVDMSQELAS